MKYIISKKSGFTLIEILIVIGLIAILAGITIVAVNPAKQFAQANNAQRRADVNTVLNAISQFMVDNNGNVPPSLSGVSTYTEICQTGAASCVGLIDLSADLVPTYLVSMPTDPTGITTNGVGYETSTTTGNRIRVRAPDAQLGAIIEVSR